MHCVGSREHLSACTPGTYYRSSTLYPQNRHARTAYACARCWNVSAVSVHARYVLRTAQEHRSSTLPAEEARTYCVRLCPLLECVSCQRARQVRTTYRSRARCPHARYVLRTAPARCLHDRRSRVAGSCSSRQM